MWCPVLFGNGAPEEIRTPNLLIRSQMLYPIELRARMSRPAWPAAWPASSMGRGPACGEGAGAAVVAGAETSGADPHLQGVRRARGAAPQSTRKSLNWAA